MRGRGKRERKGWKERRKECIREIKLKGKERDGKRKKIMVKYRGPSKRERHGWKERQKHRECKPKRERKGWKKT